MNGLTINIIILAAALVVMLFCLWRGYESGKRAGYMHMWDFQWCIAWVLCAIIVVGAALALSINTLGAHVEETTCGKWGKAVEREVKFIRPSYWSWDCLIQTDEGWVSRDAIIKVDD